jgi:hypothetical protein
MPVAAVLTIVDFLSIWDCPLCKMAQSLSEMSGIRLEYFWNGIGNTSEMPENTLEMLRVRSGDTSGMNEEYVRDRLETNQDTPTENFPALRA